MRRSRASPAPGTASDILVSAVRNARVTFEPRPLRRRRRPPVAPAHAERRRQLMDQLLQLGLPSLGSLEQSGGERIVGLRPELLDAMPVGRAGPCVEHRAGIAESSPIDHPVDSFHTIDQIQGVALDARPRHELGDVTQSLAVGHPRPCTVEVDRPPLALMRQLGGRSRA